MSYYNTIFTHHIDILTIELVFIQEWFPGWSIKPMIEPCKV